MKGLFIKDLRLIKNQRNFLITLALMFLVLIVTGVDASFFMGYVPFLLLIVTMSTITYDEQDFSWRCLYPGRPMYWKNIF